MAQQSFTRTVLDTTLATAEKNGGEATVHDISVALGAMTRQEHKNVLNALSELFGQGRLQRPRQGVYAPAASAKKPEKREVMWRLLRTRKPGVTVDDLVEMAEVSSDYADEWLRMLAKREVVRRIDRPGSQPLWILIKDSLEMPEDDSKAARLRELRAKKKAELAGRIEGIENELKAIKTTIAEL